MAAEALGAAVAPVPFLGLAMATLAVLRVGTPGQQDLWLPRIADSEALFGVGFGGLAGQTGETRVTFADGHLTGRVSGAVDCGMCSHLLVVLADGQMVIVPADDPGVRMTPRHSLDRTTPVTDLEFDAAPAELLSAVNAPLENALRVLDAGRVLVAAGTLGAAQTMLDRAVDFAKQRVQFGRVIGSFQGLQHRLADLHVLVESARSLSYAAAEAAADDAPDLGLQAAAARASCSEALSRAAAEMIQMHGAIGITWEHDAHRYFKRAHGDAQLLGPPSEHVARIAAALLDPSPAQGTP